MMMPRHFSFVQVYNQNANTEPGDVSTSARQLNR